MSDFFELVDWSTGNVIDDFDTEEEALADLLAEGRQNGFDNIRTYALLRYLDGHPTLIAMEGDLVTYLRQRDGSQAASIAPAFEASSIASEAPELGFHISRQLGQLTAENSLGLGGQLASITGLGASSALASGVREGHQLVASQASTFSAMAEAISSAVVVADLFSSKTLHVTTTYVLVFGVPGDRVKQSDTSGSNSTETTRLELVELIRAA